MAALSFTAAELAEGAWLLSLGETSIIVVSPE
jgi:hypothetical protein